MAWTEKLPSGRYRGMFRASDGRKRSVGTFDGKRAAQNAATAAEVGAKNERPSSDLSWSEWEARWTPGRSVAAATKLEDGKRIEKHVRPRWGEVKLEDISRSEVQSWASELAASGLSPSTTRKIVGVLSASMRAALRLDVIAVNPCTDIELPRIPPSPEHWLTDEEVDALRGTLDESQRFCFELLLGTGLRWGEAVGLHWSHVDLDRRQIEVLWSFDRKSKTMKPPKSHQRRTVPIGDTLVEMLGARLDERGWGSPPDLPYLDMKRPAHGLVLATPGGTPPNGTSFALAVAAAGKSAFVGEGERRRRVGNVRPHDLRHTFASRLVQRGINIQAVSNLLGHSSLTVTTRYASLGQSQFDAIRDVLG